MIETGLKNKVAIVTGGNNPYGIGAAAAKALAAQGAKVLIHYFRFGGSEPSLLAVERRAPDEPGERFYLLQHAKSADDVVRMIRESGGQADSFEADLAVPSSIPQVFDQAERSFGPVDILVNNAALCEADTFVPQSQLGPDSRAVDESPMSTITAEKHDRHFAVNSRAVALMMAEYARRHVALHRASGQIINVSTDGASGFSSEASYGASKHALESYSRAAAAELGIYGIRVNIVALGPIQTGWITPDIQKAIAGKTPLRRVGRPDDVADVIVFLASEQARWLTGQLLYVGGGWQMSL